MAQNTKTEGPYVKETPSYKQLIEECFRKRVKSVAELHE